jgi:hypothetical protein
MSKVLTSRRFWVFVIAQAVSILTFIASNYLPDPKIVELAALLIGTIQGVAAIIVALYTVDDINGIKANQAIEVAKAQNPEAPTP